jgi:pseudouridine-5'-phosphate glycosidase
MHSAVLVVNPPPEDTCLPHDEVEAAVQKALQEAEQANIVGAAITPFLLDRVSALSHGKSLRANLDLLNNNAQLAAAISVLLYERKGIQRA